MQVVYEGLQLPIDQALRVESRWFAKSCARRSGSMIRSLFVSMQELNKGGAPAQGCAADDAQENRRDRAGFMGAASRL